ncbi:MAG: peptidase [Verrucomicrobiales bacterium]|nr:peptidase [Verrucomicrobiales bacterium]
MFLLILIGTMAISFWASSKVKSSYAKYSRYANSSGMTGAQAAAAILQNAGIRDVQIAAQRGELTDHYDPMRKRLLLSENNFYGRSLAAVGIAAHEAGHALQHASAYAPLHLRMASVGITNVASQLVTWLPMLFMFTGFLNLVGALWIIAIGWGIIMAFNLVTLPVEFDASARAKKLLLNLGIVSVGAEEEGVSKMLGAAALTYVAAFLTSLAYFLCYLLPLLGGRRD